MLRIAKYLTPSAYIRYTRRQVLAADATLRDLRDGRHLRAGFPRLAETLEVAPRFAAALRSDYDEYVSAVSTSSMAISLELAGVLAALCSVLKPRRVVDFGSGFSSYVLRAYGSRANSPVGVWSVDDDPVWLARTSEYLASKGVRTDGLLSWNEFVTTGEDAFDLVLHDLASDPIRSETLPVVLGLVRAGGLAVLDDIQKPEYRATAYAASSMLGWPSFSVSRATKDSFGRYAMLVVRPLRS